MIGLLLRQGPNFLVVAAGFGAGFEQVEQAAVLEQKLLAAESKRSLAGHCVGGSFDHRHDRCFVRQRGRRGIDAGSSSGTIQQAADGPPIAD